MSIFYKIEFAKLIIRYPQRTAHTKIQAISYNLLPARFFPFFAAVNQMRSDVLDGFPGVFCRCIFILRFYVSDSVLCFSFVLNPNFKTGIEQCLDSTAGGNDWKPFA